MVNKTIILQFVVVSLFFVFFSSNIHRIFTTPPFPVPQNSFPSSDSYFTFVSFFWLKHIPAQYRFEDTLFDNL